MRIWWINQVAIPPDQNGGTRHYSFARELIRRGHDVTLITSSFLHYEHRAIRLEEGEEWRYQVEEGVPFLWLRIPGYKGNTLARLQAMLAFAWRVWRGRWSGELPRPDLIVGSSPTLYAALAAERLARRLGTAFMLEIRDLWPQTLIDVGGHSRLHPAIASMELVERYLYRQADGIITLMPSADLHVEEKGGDRSKATWVSNGVDVALLPAPTRPTGEGPFTVMYAGGHGPSNALDALVDAAALLDAEFGEGPRARILLVGAGPEKARLEARVKAEKIRTMAFAPPVPKQEVFQLLQQADAFVLTHKPISLYKYGVSYNKLYDYLAAGRPVIFGTVSSNNPVVDAGAGLSVAAAHPGEIAQAIRTLMAMSPEERWQMGLAGRRHIEAHYTIEVLVDRLEQALNRVVAPAGQGRRAATVGTAHHAPSASP